MIAPVHGSGRGGLMRSVVLGVAMAAFVQVAHAADLGDILRGSDVYEVGTPTYARWDGFYFGGQGGFSSANVGFSDATGGLVRRALRETALEAERGVSGWHVLGDTSTQGANFGAFVGYNFQWEDIILGVEANYTHSSLSADAAVFPISRGTSAGGNSYFVGVTGNASMHITDFGTLRARAGYSMGNWLPYAMVGLAVGRANYSRSITIRATENDAPFGFTESDGKSSAIIYGWAAGAGAEVALLPNVFLRGEYEFVQFQTPNDMRTAINTVRGGVGLKF